MNEGLKASKRIQKNPTLVGQNRAVIEKIVAGKDGVETDLEFAQVSRSLHQIAQSGDPNAREMVHKVLDEIYNIAIAEQESEIATVRELAAHRIAQM